MTFLTRARSENKMADGRILQCISARSAKEPIACTLWKVGVMRVAKDPDI